MTLCDVVQERLAEPGADKARIDEELMSHLESCEACQTFAACLAEVDDGFAVMQEHDAPDSLVTSTLQAVQEDQINFVSGSIKPRRWFAGALAASVVLVSIGTVGLYGTRQWNTGELDPLIAMQAPSSSVRADAVGFSASVPESELVELESKLGDRAEWLAVQEKAKPELFGLEEAAQPSAPKREKAEKANTFSVNEAKQKQSTLTAATSEEDRRQDTNRLIRQAAPAAMPPPPSPVIQIAPGNKVGSIAELQTLVPENREVDGLAGARKESVFRDADETVAIELAPSEYQVSSRKRAKDEQGVRVESGQKLDVSATLESPPVPVDTDAPELKKSRLADLAVNVDASREQARTFLNSHQNQSNLLFQDPVGYWANTYIPGDPAMRLLETRLKVWNRTPFGQQNTLEQAVHSVAQPFDAPENAALALYVNAEQTAIESPTRMRLQIGLKGAQLEGGHRPAMNIALVVDLRNENRIDAQTSINALILSLEQAHQPGDNFSLIATGPDGGLIVSSENFQYGSLRVATEKLFDHQNISGAVPISLPQAIALAAETVRQSEEANAILGSSLVLLATSNSLATEFEALETLVHANAVSGVPMSVISIGADASLEATDRLVAAGQGSRRVLQNASEAKSLIDRELHSASRAVARALRLRIRLAPGVKLIGIPGSHRLDEPQSQRVREAEQSLDQRLARNLGINTDRGEDEEGIQIVVPTFHAGDSHVILLDLLAEKSGPIADVRVRYKDLVYLKNGVAEASLSLGSGTAVQGPLERNVLKNLVAWELARQLREISSFLETGDVVSASRKMLRLKELISGLRKEVSGWASDPDLLADQILLNNYLSALRLPQFQNSSERRHLADSLQVAAHRKLLGDTQAAR